MSRFIESIRFERGRYFLLDYHQQRVNRTFSKFFPEAEPHQLQDILPNLQFEDKFKVRVVYTEEMVDVEYEAYIPRPVNSLQLVSAESISYSYKYADRKKLTSLFDMRGTSDDILILKDDLITDSYYANVVFWDGQNWITPSSYLLNGVKRQFLLEQGKIKEQKITKDDLEKYQKVSLINAMLDPGDVELSTAQIKTFD